MIYPSMVKTISLGMWRTSPLNQHTLGLHTSNFCFSFETRYRHLVGSLVYLAVTRPDISYPVHILSQFVSAFMSNNLQMIYHELSFIHVLMLYVISPYLT